MIERSKEMSGEVLRAMMVRVASWITSVRRGGGASSSARQPSSQAVIHQHAGLFLVAPDMVGDRPAPVKPVCPDGRIKDRRHAHRIIDL